MERSALILGICSGLVALATVAMFAAAPARPANDDRGHDHASTAQRAVPEESGARVRESASPPGAAYGPFDAPVGSRLEFELRARLLTGTSGAVGGNSAEQSRIITGDLLLCVLDRRDDRAAVQVCMDEVRVAGVDDSDAVQRTVRALRRGLVLQIDECGELQGVRFASAIPAAERNLWRTLLLAMRVVVDPTDDGPWTREEQRVDGCVTASYRWLSPAIDREDRAVERRVCGAVVTRDPTSTRPRPSVTARTRATLSADVGWLRSVTNETSCAIEVLGVRLCEELALTATLCSVSRGAGAAVDWDAPWSPMDGHADATRSLDAAEGRQQVARLAGVRIDEIVAAVLEALECGVEPDAVTARALRDLGWKLRLDPDAAAVAAATLCRTGCDERVACLLLDALAFAGTMPAQRALAGVVADACVAPWIRDRAILASFRVADPLPALVEPVRMVAADGSIGAEVRERAILALGTLSRRGSAEAAATLFALEARAECEGKLLVWLGALANERSDRAVDAALRHLRNADPAVRSAAVEVLSARHNRRSDRALEALVRGDPSAVVRGEAARVLAARLADAELLEFETLVLGDASATARGAAAQGLGTRPMLGSNAFAFLSRMATGDPDTDVRRIARDLLGRKGRRQAPR